MTALESLEVPSLMVKVVEGGQCAATRARFSPGVRTGLHVVAAEATDTPRPMAIETAKTSQSFLKVPLLTSLSPRSSVCPMSGARASTPRLNSCTRIAHPPRSDQPTAAVLWSASVRHYEETGRSHDNTRRQPITARDAHGCLTGVFCDLRRTPFSRTSENSVKAKFAEFLF